MFAYVCDFIYGSFRLTVSHHWAEGGNPFQEEAWARSVGNGKTTNKSDLLMGGVPPCLKLTTCNMNLCCSQCPCLNILYAQRAPIPDIIGSIPNSPHTHTGLWSQVFILPTVFALFHHRADGGRGIQIFSPTGSKPISEGLGGPESGWNSFLTQGPRS